MFDWFSKKEKIQLKVDIHSHLLPGIDDGVKSMDEAIAIIRKLSDLGYQKLVTTPHIYPDLYPNSPETILPVFQELRKALDEAGVKMEMEAAAEYFIDPSLIEILDQHGDILHFGQEKYVLMETAFTSKAMIFDEVVFKMKSAGYTPVLAHPERYEYLQGDLTWLKEIRGRGVRLQVSTPSLVGAYGETPKKMAEKLLSERMVDFLGSDLHRMRQMPGLEKSLEVKIKSQNLLNNKLL